MATTFTVSELNENIKNIFDSVFTNDIKVIGEISGIKLSNGNLFFKLKDDESLIDVRIWRYKDNIPENGEKVLIQGKITCYTKLGMYNLTGRTIQKLGTGKLQEEYNLIKQECENKGYFDINLKKPLPNIINKLAIVTAPKGAALKDIEYVLNSNKFSGEVLVKRCIVQGKLSAQSIVKCIQELDDRNFDVILITRGGGSLEDLISFSDIKVIEAIYNAKTFIMSAVGHEVDTMLCDLVADYRAPTPSVAGQVISKINNNLIDKLEDFDYLISEWKNKINYKLDLFKIKLNNYKKNNISPVNKLDKELENINNLRNMFDSKIYNKINSIKNKINLQRQNLENNNITGILNKNFALLEINNTVAKSEDIFKNKKMKIILKDRVININYSIIEDD
jgi:exodeoxyribonuclease VII large subunit